MVFGFRTSSGSDRQSRLSLHHPEVANRVSHVPRESSKHYWTWSILCKAMWLLLA